MTAITTRSKVSIRTTTAPADMGYGGTPTNWLEAPADVVTSPAKALEYLSGLRSKFGGADYRVDLRVNGQPVTRDDLTEAVIAAEERRA